MAFIKCAFYIPFTLSSDDDIDSYIARNKEPLSELVKKWWIEDKYKNSPEAIEDISKTRTLLPSFVEAIEKWIRKIIDWSVPFKGGRIFLYARDYQGVNFDDGLWKTVLYIGNYLSLGNWADYDPLYIFKTIVKLMDARTKVEVQINFVSYLVYYVLKNRENNVEMECLDYFKDGLPVSF